MMTIALKKAPLQQFTVLLNNQRCEIRLYYCGFTDDLFVDLKLNDRIILQGVKAENGNRIVRYKYLGFSGDLIFIDSQGNDNPVYTGFGDRWDLYYMTEEELSNG